MKESLESMVAQSENYASFNKESVHTFESAGAESGHDSFEFTFDFASMCPQLLLDHFHQCQSNGRPPVAWSCDDNGNLRALCFFFQFFVI